MNLEIPQYSLMLENYSTFDQKKCLKKVLSKKLGFSWL